MDTSLASSTINTATLQDSNMIYDQLKPILIFTGLSFALLTSYIYLFYDKIKFIPISQICCWISSIILVALITNSLFYMVKEGKMLKGTMTVIIYVLMIGCILSSLGSVWNTSQAPEIKINFNTPYQNV